MVSPARVADLEKRGYSDSQYQFQSFRPKEAAALLGIGPATLWRWIRERPDFPRPINLSARVTVFAGNELLAWRDSRQKAVAGKPQGSVK